MKHNLHWRVMRMAEIDRIVAWTEGSTQGVWSKQDYQSEFRCAHSFQETLYLCSHEASGALREDLAAVLVFRLLVDEVELMYMATAPDFRRRGVGVLVIERLKRRSFALKAVALHLEVHERNDAARRLYEKQGFKKVGRRENYYSKDKGSALLYSFRLPQSASLG